MSLFKEEQVRQRQEMAAKQAQSDITITQQLVSRHWYCICHCFCVSIYCICLCICLCISQSDLYYITQQLLSCCGKGG